jgi:hypothetical protein
MPSHVLISESGVLQTRFVNIDGSVKWPGRVLAQGGDYLINDVRGGRRSNNPRGLAEVLRDSYGTALKYNVFYLSVENVTTGKVLL